MFEIKFYLVLFIFCIACASCSSVKPRPSAREPAGLFGTCEDRAVGDAMDLAAPKMARTVKLNHYDSYRAKAWVDFINLNQYCVIVSYKSNMDCEVDKENSSISYFSCSDL